MVLDIDLGVLRGYQSDDKDEDEEDEEEVKDDNEEAKESQAKAKLNDDYDKERSVLGLDRDL